MCVDKTESVENLQHEPRMWQYLREENESSVNNIGWDSFSGWFAE